MDLNQSQLRASQITPNLPRNEIVTIQFALHSQNRIAIASTSNKPKKQLTFKSHLDLNPLDELPSSSNLNVP